MNKNIEDSSKNGSKKGAKVPPESLKKIARGLNPQGLLAQQPCSQHQQ